MKRTASTLAMVGDLASGPPDSVVLASPLRPERTWAAPPGFSLPRGWLPIAHATLCNRVPVLRCRVSMRVAYAETVAIDKGGEEQILIGAERQASTCWSTSDMARKGSASEASKGRV